MGAGERVGQMRIRIRPCIKPRHSDDDIQNHKRCCNFAHLSQWHKPWMEMRRLQECSNEFKSLFLWNQSKSIELKRCSRMFIKLIIPNDTRIYIHSSKSSHVFKIKNYIESSDLSGGWIESRIVPTEATRNGQEQCQHRFRYRSWPESQLRRATGASEKMDGWVGGSWWWWGYHKKVLLNIWQRLTIHSFHSNCPWNERISFLKYLEMMISK